MLLLNKSVQNITLGNRYISKTNQVFWKFWLSSIGVKTIEKKGNIWVNLTYDAFPFSTTESFDRPRATSPR